MELRLVSAKSCPFVQRSVILLEEKGSPYDVSYVDLDNKPQWFLKQSPRGKVPVLVVDGTVLFESQAICEFLDETQGNRRLMPDDALLRARDRAWFAFAGEELFGPQYRLMLTDDEGTYRMLRGQLKDRLARLESEKPGLWLSGNGDEFGLADVAVAPFFTRVRLLERWTGETWLSSLPRLQEWSAALLERASVAHSVPPDFEQEIQRMMRQHNAYALNQ